MSRAAAPARAALPSRAVALLAACLATAALAAQPGPGPTGPTAQAPALPRLISVTGRGSAPFKPDFVELDFAVVSKAKDYGRAQADNLAAVERALRVLGDIYRVGREDVATLDYRLDEDRVYENGQQRLAGYVATARLRARIREIGAYRAIIGSLLDAGVNQVLSLSFGALDWAELRKEALVAAYRDAEEKARATAAAAGARLGPAIEIRESGGQPGPLPARNLLRAEGAALAAGGFAAGNGEVISSGNLVVEAEAWVLFPLEATR